jgi:DNA-binding transcriptional regulator GbsR (MarR family)
VWIERNKIKINEKINFYLKKYGFVREDYSINSKRLFFSVLKDFSKIKNSNATEDIEQYIAS